MNIFDLIINDKEDVSLNDVILGSENRYRISQLIKEYNYIDELLKYRLPVNNKLLLHGESGCGKTMTAKAIAKALGKKILILNLSNVVSSRIGETSQHLKQVFDKAAKEQAVLFLDEFDLIGKMRSSEDKDVGEMRRLVNTLIQLIDYFPASALLVCATNHPEVIDVALWRRFQLKIKFDKPDAPVLDTYYNQLLSAFPDDLKDIDRLYDISFAEAKDAALTQVKARLIAKLEKQNERVEPAGY